MNATNKTLYIPLYGKSFVSRKGILLHDPKAEEIWSREAFPLHGKPKSKWLAYYMGMRAAVTDRWTQEKLTARPDAVVLHLGCGLDARCLRVKAHGNLWYDVDMPDVITVRKQYYDETEDYRMIGADVTELSWLEGIPAGGHGIIVMEGLSMYLPMERLTALFAALGKHFSTCEIVMDVYTEFAVRASRYRNPIKSVGAGVCTGVDVPQRLENEEIQYRESLSMTPQWLTNQLSGMERWFFCLMFAGKATEAIYRMYTFEKI